MSGQECLWVLLSSWFSKKNKVTTFKITSLQYFGNFKVNISSNNDKMDILKIYKERAAEKCPRWNPSEAILVHILF